MIIKQHFIPLNGQRIPVSEEIYYEYYRPIWAIRKRAQAHGQCMCPGSKLWKCNGDCPACSYHAAALIIAYGDGRNGKSSFWNAVSRVLGLYSGNISADTLTVGCRRNIKPEMAEVNGKRLLIAAELQEGTRLNNSVVKQLCSTDDVFAEKKYKNPFSFKPCHTLVLSMPPTLWVFRTS